jgi:hypothetical protein
MVSEMDEDITSDQLESREMDSAGVERRVIHV